MASVSARPPRNGRVAFLAAAGALAMLGAGFAAVPLYRLFCQKTGYGGTPARASEVQAAGIRANGKTMSVRFDGNLESGLRWTFGPEQTTRTVPLGVRSIAFFDAENLTDAPVTGRATYNIEPDLAAPYFTKIQCFCFNEQTLAPHQKVRMPVVFYVDPRVLSDPELKGLQQITLSYTFHAAPKAG